MGDLLVSFVIQSREEEPGLDTGSLAHRFFECLRSRRHLDCVRDRVVLLWPNSSDDKQTPMDPSVRIRSELEHAKAAAGQTDYGEALM